MEPQAIVGLDRLRNASDGRGLRESCLNSLASFWREDIPRKRFARSFLL